MSDFELSIEKREEFFKDCSKFYPFLYYDQSKTPIKPRFYRGESLDLKNKWNDYYVYSGPNFGNKQICRGNYVLLCSLLGSKPFYSNVFSVIFMYRIPKEIYDKYKCDLIKNNDTHHLMVDINIDWANIWNDKIINRYIQRFSIFEKLKQQKIKQKFVVWVLQRKIHENLVQKICEEYFSTDITKIDIKCLKWHY